MDAITIHLPQSLEISSVNDVKQMILEQISSNIPCKKLHIDSAKLTRIDTAGLQLLTALIIDLEKQEIEFSWENINQELSDNALSLGLSKLLKLH